MEPTHTVVMDVNGVECTHAQLREALREAGLAESYAREILPRSAMLRACRTMKANGYLIDELKNSSDGLRFQINERRLSDGRFKYPARCVLLLCKADSKLLIEPPEKGGLLPDGAAELRVRMEELLEQATDMRNGRDVSNLVDRIGRDRGMRRFVVSGKQNTSIVALEDPALLDRMRVLLSRIPVKGGRTASFHSYKLDLRDASTRADVAEVVCLGMDESVAKYEAALAAMFDDDQVKARGINALIKDVEEARAEVKLFEATLEGTHLSLRGRLDLVEKKAREMLSAAEAREAKPRGRGKGAA